MATIRSPVKYTTMEKQIFNTAQKALHNAVRSNDWLANYFYPPSVAFVNETDFINIGVLLGVCGG
jgi:hypothetical protein